MSSTYAIGASPKQLFATSLTETSTTDVEGVGTIRLDQYGNVYRWVKYVGSDALQTGYVMCHSFADGANMFQAISKPATANLAALAGVVITAVSAGNITAQYCWILVRGYAAALGVHHYAAAGTSYTVGEYCKAADGTYYLVPDAAAQPAYSANIQIGEVDTAGSTASDLLTHTGFVNCL